MKTAVQCDSVEVNGVRAAFGACVDIADEVLDLDRLTLTVSDDYYTRFRRRNFVSETVSAAAYLSRNFLERQHRSLLCQEMPVPPHLRSSIRLSLPPHATWMRQAVAYFHAGLPGCMTPLHFDWDVAWVAHVCLTGKKRLFIFPPNAGWLLSPILNLSALCVPKFSESDRSEFVRRLGGVEVVLNAGEGLLFPSLSWHGVLYDEPSLSLSVRFEPNPGGRPFAALPKSWLLQRLVWRFFCEGYGSPANGFLIEYMKAFFDQNGRWQDRYRRVNVLCRQALLDLGEAQGAAMLVGENFSTELALAKEAVRRYYTVTPSRRDSSDPNAVKDTIKYVFDGLQVPPNAEPLAEYALEQRQGLRPRRGLVEIVNQLGAINV